MLILFCHNQITAISSQHPITGQRNASCLIFNIIGTYWVQARTVWIQIRLQVFLSKLVSMIRKYYNHKPKTNPWHREEEPHNHHQTPGRQTKQSNQLLFDHPFIRRSAIYWPLFYFSGKHIMAKYDIHIMESLPGVFGNRRNDIYSRGTGNKGQILSGTGYKGNIGEHGT